MSGMNLQQEYFKQTGHRALSIGCDDYLEYERQYIWWLEELATKTLEAQPEIVDGTLAGNS